MRRLGLASGLLWGLAIAGCVDDSTGATGDDDGGCAAIDICGAPESDPFTVTGLALEEDCLAITVSYSGGCETHDFSSCWDQSFKSSLPAQVWLKLDHDAHGDTCEAAIEETVRFDLSLVRETYQAAKPGELGGTLDIHVQGYPMPVRYDF